MKRILCEFLRGSRGSAFKVAFIMMLPFILDSACVWDLRATRILGGGGFAICKAAFFNSIFIAGLYLIGGRVIRWMCIPLLWLAAFIAAMELFVKWYFGFNFEGDWILTVLESSPGETMMFFRQYLTLPVVFFGLLIILFCIGATYALWRLKDVRRGVACYVVGGLLLVPVVIREVNADSWSRGFGSVQTKRVVADTFNKMRMYKDLYEVANVPVVKGNPILEETAKDVVGIIAVGESATRNSMSLYGYDRKTTPRLDDIANELYVFKDVVAPWGNTPMACRFILTEATLQEPDYAYCAVPQVFRKVGIDSCLISSQGRWGAYGHVGGYLFNDCSEKIYLTENSEGKCFDADVLPYFTQRYAAGSNKCYFVHFAGSHFPPESTYPIDSAAFAGDSKLDKYDNSIHHTDRVLGEMIEVLKASDRPSYLIYLSDHGETPRAETWRDPKHKDLWEIPMIVWLSPEYKKRFPEVAAALLRALDKPIQSDRIFKLFITLARVKGFVGHCCEDDVLADNFNGHPNRVLGLQNR